MKSRVSGRSLGPTKCRRMYAMSLWNPGCPANGESWISWKSASRNGWSSGMNMRYGVSRVTMRLFCN